MLEQTTGVATAAIVLLAYLLCVQALTAAAVLLSQFIVVQLRALVTLISDTRTRPTVTPPVEPEQPAYRVGGGVMRWS